MTRAQPQADPGVEAAESRKRAGDPRGAPVPSRRILGLRVDATRYHTAAAEILERARLGAGGMVCVATVHTVMESWDDPSLRRLVNSAEIVTPDGVPLVWGLRRLGLPGARRVYGPDLTQVLCARAADEELKVGFYGGSEAVLDELVARLGTRFPGLRVGFRLAPPFRPLTRDEDAEVVAAIRESDTRLLFVGLGCPKQERWMAAHRDALRCPMIGVGAAFDFLSGAKPQAPAWMQSAGLEWLFRLASEPRRLWRRYLIHNPRFLTRFALQLARSPRP